jgi:hypothetical protein
MTLSEEQRKALEAAIRVMSDGNHNAKMAGELQTLLERAQADARPVGEAVPMPGGNGGFTCAVFNHIDVPVGTKLYTAPPAESAGVALSDDDLRFVQRVLESDAPQKDRERARELIVSARLARTHAADGEAGGTANTLAGFKGACAVSGRLPTEQEIWDAGVRSGMRRAEAAQQQAERSDGEAAYWKREAETWRRACEATERELREARQALPQTEPGTVVDAIFQKHAPAWHDRDPEVCRQIAAEIIEAQQAEPQTFVQKWTAAIKSLPMGEQQAEPGADERTTSAYAVFLRAYRAGLPLDEAFAQGLRAAQSGQRAGVAERIYPDALSDALRHVLGFPNFKCSPFAHLMRDAGATIKRKAEDEQAVVLHWLIKLVLDHGEKWADAAQEEMKAMREKIVAAPTQQEGGK